MVRGAVRSGMLSSYMKSLELRVSPCNTADQTCRMIRRLDSVIGEPRDKYFYTLHFIKGEDKTDYGSSMLQCRHAVKRKKVEKQARALIALRERYPECAMRILGIDAASNEIGCRPEVFAVSFRRLKSHVRAGEDSRSTRRVPQLRATYHVGEDFLDPADGLRAIDEAVNFLNLDCGDRLGHALALGLDVEEWYRSKNYRILIPQQDYLDNLAWMYNRLIELNISGLEVLMGHLEKKYEEYFDRVYARHMDYGIIDEILKETRRQYRHAGIMNAFHNDRYRFDIFQYYKAWKLRGDDPELYERGYYLADDYGPAEMQCRLNLRFPKDYNIRYRPEIFLLNYYYQFDREVREEGNKRVEIKIHPSYIRAVQMLQKEMQKLVGRNGIAIETNPSSNFLIGTFKDYAKHPIFTFYNKGLTGDPSLLAECAQLSVSVNTDDQGVFSTSLENEYALLAVALENVKDADGKPAYAKSMVYDWIDAVRQMGNDQSFRPEGYRELLGGEETADL
ncbi:MAG: hypothetical protein LUG99_23725, partial [Lachnospiraceae bacterium]|nr:hypothetical protein [Lachnospiraceae bacterium]